MYVCYNSFQNINFFKRSTFTSLIKTNVISTVENVLLFFFEFLLDVRIQEEKILVFGN